VKFPTLSRHPSDSITAAITLLAVSLAARQWLAASLGLQKDEAFYADWARTPDASYAWLPLAAIRASVSVFGESALSVRLPFVLAMTVAGGAMFSLARTLTGSPTAGAWAVALLLGNVWAHLAGAQAHPDAFLACFWIGALAALAPHDRSRAALYLGAALAAGAALSKYTGFLLWPAWLVVEFARGRGPGERPRDLPLATLVWIALVAPSAAAIAGDQAHWLKVALHLSDWSDRAPVAARIALVPLLPLLQLMSPAAAAFAVGPWRAWRSAPAGRAMVWIGVAVAFLFTLAAMRGSLKGNWMLPAFWGTLPFGVAWFLQGPRRVRWLGALAAAGVAVVALVHAAALDPSRFDRAVERFGALAPLDRSYDSGVSAEERRYSTSRRWLDRAYDWRLAAPLADSLSRRSSRGGAAVPVVSDLYEVTYALRFHGPHRTARLMRDTRFQAASAYAPGPGSLPGRILYVTAPDVELPESFFVWYRFLEREPRLVVSLGGHASRAYDVWKCGRADESW
jgi:hypothetical protein